MQISEARNRLREELLAFCWNEWAQLGVSASRSRPTSSWAQDPETLLLTTFEVGRDDARLLDETLDWLIRNVRLVSVRRLRALSVDEIDERLAGAALDYVGRYRNRARLKSNLASPATPASGLEPLFRDALPVRAPDEAYAARGFAKPRSEPSGKSRAPDLDAPIAFAFRVRPLLGVGALPGVVRHLLTTDAPTTSLAAVTRAAGYAGRNVREALTDLESSGAVSVVHDGRDRRYSTDRTAWGTLMQASVGGRLEPRDWPLVLGAARTILRDLDAIQSANTSDYVQTSRAGDLLRKVERELGAAGITIARSFTVDDIPHELATIVGGLVALLGSAADA